MKIEISTDKLCDNPLSLKIKENSMATSSISEN